MKRLRSSDSLGALITICPTSEEQHQSSPRNGHVYGREFRAMLDDEGFAELEEDQQMMSCHVSEKKRRLSVDQVKALEKNFEVENKLEPERKVKLAQELGLQPRQVAVWFQNRRARWKTKQLERDYGHLKANYDSLKLNFETLKRDHETLQQQIKELKAKVKEEKPEATVLPAELGLNAFEATNDVVFVDHFRDGSSDSDSSAVVNDDKNGVVATGKVVAAANDMSSESSGMVKIEEHDFFGGEETTCDFFSDQQAPTMPWYCSGEDQWN